MNNEKKCSCFVCFLKRKNRDEGCMSELPSDSAQEVLIQLIREREERTKEEAEKEELQEDNEEDYEDAIAVIEDIIETARKNVAQNSSMAKRLLRTALFALEEFEGDI